MNRLEREPSFDLGKMLAFFFLYGLGMWMSKNDTTKLVWLIMYL